MFGSFIVYGGLLIAAIGLGLFVLPRVQRRALPRRRGLILVGAGVLLIGLGLVLPAPESRVGTASTRLDDLAPTWQFQEHHSLRIAASPARVFEAVRQVSADEIFLFRTLIWIRRAGQPLPESILNAPNGESLIDVATRTNFLRLVDEAPRELVIGTMVVAPQGPHRPLTPEIFLKPPPGSAVALMNFFIVPDGSDASWLSTETRVFASDSSARRRFAAYWRIIYPGSAIIRRMWLRAVQQRATLP